MVEFSLPKNSQIRVGKTWPKPASSPLKTKKKSWKQSAFWNWPRLMKNTKTCSTKIIFWIFLAYNTKSFAF